MERSKLNSIRGTDPDCSRTGPRGRTERTRLRKACRPRGHVILIFFFSNTQESCVALY